MNNVNELRCYHRHTIDSHPACFRKGLIKYDFRDDREFERMTGIPWYDSLNEDGSLAYPIGFFDLETDNLKPDYGTLLTWAIKERGGGIISSVIVRDDLFSGRGDKRLVEEFLEAIKKFRILVGYYSTGFDFPFIRAKALHYGLDFPGHTLQQRYDGKFFARPEIIHWDLYYIVRGKLRLSRNSLWNATRYLGIEGKTPISGDIWGRAKYGDPEAVAEVLKHNIADVEITERLWEKLLPYKVWTRKGA
ncbi:hypothetical protein LCGC14_1208530 [marine sediment metagenome]|uniref:YprB ribonuclease H-like domain-containing protein n=1 Tax=marine sediment metagenome TaxID=412755 RepID=A0A0F9M253_9ZZZZ